MSKSIYSIAVILLITFGAFAERPIKGTPVENLSHKEDVYEVIGHLYRWHLDEVDVRKSTSANNSSIWVRELKPELDQADKSRFAEMILPAVGVKVMLKKADYAIEEMNLKVSSPNFKITRVSRIELPKNVTTQYRLVEIDPDELRKYLFNQRGKVKFPNKKLIERMRSTVRRQLLEHLADKGKVLPKEAQTVHFSALSPVANELWAFWENGRVLIHFKSDLNVADPSIWKHDVLISKIYDIDKQVVVSLQETSGSNAYLTRDQVGRALYNCIVLGKRILLEPAEEN